MMFQNYIYSLYVAIDGRKSTYFADFIDTTQVIESEKEMFYSITSF